MPALREDIAFMRDLVREGGNASLPPWWLMVNWLGAVALGALAASPHLMLAYAACLLFVAVVPGIVLMRQESAGMEQEPVP